MATRTFDDGDLALVRRWFEGNQDSASEKMVAELEAAWCERTGAARAIGVANAMAGLHLALQAACVGPLAGGSEEDEVIVDPLVSFGALAVRYAGATPVFADVDRGSFNVDPASVRARVGPHTRAVIVTHLCGLPADVDSIVEAVRPTGAIVIEDCAHALWARSHGRPVGLLGDAGVFSFNHRKQLSTGQGGIVTFRDPVLADRIRDLRTFGRIPPTVCWNYAMPGVVAAVALAQLDRSRAYVEEDRALARRLDAAIAGCRWLVPQRVDPGLVSSCHLWMARWDGDDHGVDRAAFDRISREEGADYFLFGLLPAAGAAGARPSVAAPVYRYPLFADLRGVRPSPVAEEIADRLFHTTLSPLPRERVERLAEGLARAIERIGR